MDKDKVRVALAAPFDPQDIEWRVQQAGGFDKKPWAMVLAYVTNRAIMERLDEVVGIANWRNEYQPAPDGGIMCGLSIRIGDDWVTKWDGAENTQVEAVKGGLSNAMKRAAVQWGIGRYLYKLESNFVSLAPVKPSDMTGWSHHYEKKTNSRHYWKIPVLPEWALPKEATDEAK